MYSLPQELEVWYIIPAIRKEYAKILIEKHKLTLEEAGKILGISKSAISQYLNNKRAQSFEIPSKIKKEIERSVAKIIRDKRSIVSEMNKINLMIKSEGYTCSLCKKHNSEIIKICQKNKANC